MHTQVIPLHQNRTRAHATEPAVRTLVTAARLSTMSIRLPVPLLNTNPRIRLSRVIRHLRTLPPHPLPRISPRMGRRAECEPPTLILSVLCLVPIAARALLPRGEGMMLEITSVTRAVLGLYCKLHGTHPSNSEKDRYQTLEACADCFWG
ncbi:hypothetical protein BJ322DRAFT_817716 [Thelephora terrestris]|uniref:Uncharacterized protein n=1 Tax=Thelephora terrestris TaxID=56493 RepID=A0A9P6HE81_9AGAM|nr:hypothetical protein BJ322DRAFT_817716 [Thelephora terrestris]